MNSKRALAELTRLDQMLWKICSAFEILQAQSHIHTHTEIVLISAITKSQNLGVMVLLLYLM